MKVTSLLLLALAACGSSAGKNGNPDGNTTGDGQNHGDGSTDGRGTDGSMGSAARTVFVIPMENESASAIYGNTTGAPYINMLKDPNNPVAAWATMFKDQLPTLIPSEPHYVWMEAGTSSFSDITFLTDSDASANNSTSSTAHLTAQLNAAGIGWMSYQEGIPANTCPISSIGSTYYAAKHDPFVFFQDISGTTPDTGTAGCKAHHKPYSAFATDLAAGNMPAYVFITPNLCHDMHGASGCPSGTGVSANITAGDTWLQQELPRILAYANAHEGIVYVVWDEGSTNSLIPFLALGPHVKPGADPTVYDQSSQVKSIEKQLGVPVLSAVTNSADFTAMFQPGYFP